ncbi:uncharacterized protein LOC124438856 [Xenia sp. Carnegie-2017]|uniref:uncharacterized protein LOC124438856 n=1 Tax=Xenia sp. Carnegie-2017 TaxID=2897299 RepID=UPI001F046F4E|nr:uncharacterized protein LOC124438856 [Xenia sp. Carnegie-2017]
MKTFAPTFLTIVLLDLAYVFAHPRHGYVDDAIFSEVELTKRDGGKCYKGKFSRDKRRINCGYPGITRQQCESKGCCYDVKFGDFYCYYKAGFCNSVKPGFRINAVPRESMKMSATQRLLS